MTFEWIFAYGSLVWRPGFEFEQSSLAHLSGWKRVFSQASPDHRGTPELPGRVLTLKPASKVSCQGIAYRIDVGQMKPILEYLDIRESGGYSRKLVDIALDNGQKVQALTYIALPDNPHACSDESIETVIELIKTRQGPSGSNLDYVLNLAKSLSEHGIQDDAIDLLVDALSPHYRQ